MWFKGVSAVLREGVQLLSLGQLLEHLFYAMFLTAQLEQSELMRHGKGEQIGPDVVLCRGAQLPTVAAQ